jgi:hypothetical protein
MMTDEKKAKENPKTDEKPAAEMANTRGDRDTDREETGRQARVPLGGAQLKLTAPQREGYHRHFFNDDGNRIQDAKAAGYSFVKEKVKGKNVDTKRLVGTKESGNAMNAYLMEIPLEFYKEDQALKQRPIDEIDAAIMGGLTKGADGADEGKFYTPDEGSTMKVTN